MQWSGPNIQVPFCVCNKNEKKLKYPVKPHERFSFGFSFCVNDFFPKKSNLQHCQTSKLIFSTVFKLFLKKLVGFFFPKTFKTIYIKFCLKGFCLWLVCIYSKKKERFDLNFGQHAFLSVLLLLAALLFYRSEIGALFQNRTK